ncbi:Periplasmic pH-dependent serine endoprotease DegQ precursor [Corynebacterium glaucum]|uniref:Periplasmic pH-dependent serine endoprotease DegQ n=1 Tax=Corynebacterium glaucum TaxID=187491 RepID=A0A1Q2HV61_9CORY|nr:Periplasmic pH-dependent serine endoprotease DegQ precursor [Corynebacterium glaucum]
MSNAYPPQGPYEPNQNSSYEPSTSNAGVQPALNEPQSNPASQPKRRSGVGAAIAVATVTSLLVGGGAGYLAGSNATPEPRDFQNSLNQPVTDLVEEAPDGSVEKVAAAVLPAVVSIEVIGQRSAAEGSGSIVSSDGYVLTNHHVIESAADNHGEITVTLNDGSRHPATYVASDVNTDIGVIKIDGVENLPTLEFGNSNDLRVGQQVVAIGSPLGLSATVTSGIVSALNRPVRAGQGGGESSLMDGIQTDAAINPGNSGGPLVDMQGRLVGMNSVIASLSSGGPGGQGGGSIGLGFAIPSNFAQRVANQLIESGEAKQPMLGVQVNVMGDASEGAVIADVQPGSPAEQAGLKQGETIIRLNDRPIESADALIAATRSRDFGETVTLEVRGTDGELRTVEVTLSSE